MLALMLQIKLAMRQITNPIKQSLLFFMLMLLSSSIMGQGDLTSLLKGSWRVEGTEVYENWQEVSGRSLKGLSYQIEGSDVKILEVLALTLSKKSWTYSARVIDQNKGATVDFKQVNSDSSWCFENKKHDFPKRICYHFQSHSKILVSLSGDGREPVELILTRMTAETATSAEGANPNYDSALADRLGGDEYGMKPYMLVMLRSGVNDTVSSDRRQELFRGHMENISRLEEEGKLIVAGPLGPNQWGYRGIFILDVRDMAEANILLKSDPAIENGVLAADILPWYGSAALPEYLPVSEKIWKVKP